MAQKPSEDKKVDLSSLPRGAIGIKGLPISRNTRLPSIRSPRDLTLGTPPKRTFMPKIPPRRDKKPHSSPDNKAVPHKVETSPKLDKKMSPQNESKQAGGRGKKQIIQTEGCVFGEGIADNPISRKEKMREAYLKSDHTAPSKSTHVKQEKMDVDVANVSKKMDELFRDDFLDDGDDDDDDVVIVSRPTIFPKTEVKREACKTAEPTASFNENGAADVGFDVNQVKKFIKKEKEMGTEKKEHSAVSVLNELSTLLNADKPQLVLLQFPKVVTLPQTGDDSSPENTKSNSSGPKASEAKKISSTSISSLPEGHIGKLQVMKSGKAKLVIGSLSFDLDSISNLRSRHEAVSVRTDSESGDLSVLGYMGYKLTFAPNVNSLLS